ANPSLENGAACPPDTKGEPPTVGGGSSAPLSDKLAQSKGVICRPLALTRKCRLRRRAAVDSRSFRRLAHRAEIQMYSRSEFPRDGGLGRRAAVARSRGQWLAAVCARL